MRILKVQFSNLNSLGGTWSVDFEHPDYQSDGLFLITGPTGAGKTTLLDAICLGLFGRSPRVEVSGSQNEIMTRHTGFCSSEVTFEAGGKRYRASWSHQRARKSPTGKLQSPQHELALIDGEILSDKATDAKNKIQEYCGLDFEQFIRSVLLSQNQFDIFLKADDEKKSAILEKLTDTSIYTEISIAAHEKNRDARERLERAQAELAALALPDPDVLAAQKLRILEIDQALTDLDKSLEKTRTLINDCQQIHKLEAERQLLFEKRCQLEHDIFAFQPDSQKLASAQLAREVEPIYINTANLRQQQKTLQNNRQTALAQLQRRELGLELAKDKFDQAAQAAENHAHAMEEAKPVLEQARLLDAQIAEKTKELRQLEQEAAKRIEQQKELAARSTVLSSQADRLREQQTQNCAWLQAHVRDEWLEENLAAFQARTAQLGRMRKDHDQLLRQLQTEDKKLEQLNRNLEREQASIEAFQRAKADCQAILDDYATRRNAMLAGWTLDGLKKSLQDRLILEERYKSLEDHRKQLRENTPCPLCGSLSHPWADGQASDLQAMSIQCRELEKRIRDLEEFDLSMAKTEKDRDAAILGLEKSLATLNGLREQGAQLRSTLANLNIKSGDLGKEITDMESSLSAKLEPLNVPHDLAYEKIATVLQQRLNDLRGQKQLRDKLTLDLHACEKEMAAASEKLANANQGLDAANAAAAAVRDKVEQMTRQRQDILPGKSVRDENDRLAENMRKANATRECMRQTRDKNEEDYQKTKGSLLTLEENLAELAPRLEQNEKLFQYELAARQMDEKSFLAMRMDEASRQKLENTARQLENRENSLKALEEGNSNALTQAKARLPEAVDENILQSELRNLTEERDNLQRERAELGQRLKQDAQQREKAASLQALVESRKRESKRWAALDREIGSADGKKFRSFAQSITLDRLLAYANRQLAAINPRYTLRRAPAADRSNRSLELEVIDHYQAGEIRSIKNLSGGETFMASLALALGLSEMAGRNTPLGSLFLDEGFGTLDREALDMAFAAIGKLKQSGKMIGIISHVDTLKEWIPTQIHLEPSPDNAARSRLRGPGCSGQGC